MVIKERVADLLSRWEELRDPTVDPELTAITLAVIVEDVFDVTIPEASLDLRVLGDPQTLTDLLDTVIGVA